MQNFKYIVRTLLRYKSFTTINLLGLSIGVACAVLIFLIAGYENSFDKFHSGGEHIYRVVNKTNRANQERYQATVPYPTARFLRNEYAGAIATQIHYVQEMNVRVGNQSPIEEEDVLFADSLFFTVFDFANLPGFRIAGNIGTALMEPRKAVLTESTAKKYFGAKNPIGQIIRLDNRADVEVAGVIKDIPATTHLPFTLLVSFSTLNRDFFAGLDPDSWGFTSSGYCYLKLADIGAIAQVEKALQEVIRKNAESDHEKREKLYLQQLDAIHLDPTFEDGNPSYTVSSKYLMMLLFLGGFIVLIACVNYINLATSLAFSKSKEIGIRKTIGASRLQLFRQYMLETFLVTIIATLLGFLFVSLLLPTLNQLLDKSIAFEQVFDRNFMMGTMGLVLFISFISGIYPALILSGFNPIDSLKNQLSTPGKASGFLRKALVVFQFTASITLIICTIVIARQMHYFHNKSLGFNKEAVIEVGLPVNDSMKMQTFRNLLQNQAGIENISFCLGAPISDNGFGTSLQAPELPKNVDYNIHIIPCDKEYLKTYGLKLLAGRWFLPEEEKNPGEAIVVNETIAKIMGYKNPSDVVGKKIQIGINHYKPQIIGVTQDFHVNSFHENISPVGLMPFRFFYYAAGIRIQPGNPVNTLSAIETAWKKVYPEYVYEMTFIDDTLEERYVRETRDYSLFKAFSVISIFICCIGLWGLIAFVVVRKTREIGIRKVLGASIQSIVALLSKDFLKLVVIALLVASPIAWYFMSKWLQDFAYRITIQWWVFIVAGSAALLIALLTVSFQAIKAGVANPVRSLRTE